MTLRKGAAVFSPMPGRTMKPGGVSAEYIEAIKTLDEPTLNQVFEWALDELEESADKILEVYQKSHGALQIIQKHKHTFAVGSPAQGPPGAPNLSAVGMPGRPQHRGSLPKLSGLANKKPATIAKGGVMPMRRTAMTKPGGRMRTDSDADISQAAKKARLNPPSGDNPMAPPQSALNFLAKLNKDGNNAKAAQATNEGQKRNPSRTAHRRSSA